MIHKSRNDEIVDFIGLILLLFTLTIIVFMAINSYVGFLPNDVAKVFTYIRESAILALIALKGFQYTLKRSLILSGILLVLLVLAGVFMFLPNGMPTWGYLFK